MQPPIRPPPFMPPNVQAAPAVMPPGQSTFSEDEPAAKKSKVDAGPESNLIPESMYLQKHKGSVTFQVQVPAIPDKSEWKCNGQKIFLTLPLTDPVGVKMTIVPWLKLWLPKSTLVDFEYFVLANASRSNSA